MRRIIVALCSALLLLGATATSSSPVGATPPQEAVFEDFIVLFPDLDVNKSVFINITARDFCDWLAEAEPFFIWEEAFFLYQEYQAFLEAGGDPEDFFVQPPPTDPGPPPDFPGPPPAIDPVVGIGVGTGQGAIVGRIDQELYIEMWNFDEDPSPLVGPCEDIAQQLESGAAPWATGTARFNAKSNDVDQSGTRGRAFGDRTTAQVFDQDGNEYSYRNVFRLNDQCKAPEFAPPTCLVDNSKLQPR